MLSYCVMSNESTPHPIISKMMKMVKCVNYIAIYGKILTTMVIHELGVILLTGTNLLEETECHRSPIMGICDTF